MMIRPEKLMWEALLLAIEAHGDQRYGDDHYGVHLMEVLDIVRQHAPGDIELHAAALLHDSVEDTSMTTARIREGCGDRVAGLVDAVTDGAGRNRKERKERPYRLIPTVPGALTLKLADRLANIRSCIRTRNHGLLTMYSNEHATLRERLMKSIVEPPAGQIWVEICATLAQETVQ